MRKKPMQNNYSNHRNKPRYPQQGQGGGGHHHGGHGGNRPRRNYAASREKYLAQARDALSAGDRVLAENYFQHADHCYRMMMEEGFRPRPQGAPGQPGEEGQPQAAPQQQGQEEPAPGNQLPAFITSNYDRPPQEAAPAAQWEEE